MNLWTWVLIGLCAAALILMIVSIVPVITRALRLRSRLKDLKNSRLFVSLQSLQLQANRFSNSGKKLQNLSTRTARAADCVRTAATLSGIEEVRASLHRSGSEVQTLLEDLR
jgi:biopolymer transport protein ExbB/TolQ